ncbi:nucleotide exchange factor GrpE [Oceanibacterium hippocampi]|uniref:Protein GrpE n=1 Tax=Oceanibacterium hippocampi TaxID=745714 RepID=A0A1Y5RI29_9PROT|nr:nucleotide exchange factor GrpE [Oceanibacterium hippocampi]SLN18100.1 heat shock protein GrpE [Oceanibacterium hippocampi]
MEDTEKKAADMETEQNAAGTEDRAEDVVEAESDSEAAVEMDDGDPRDREIADLKDRLLRAMADAENTRRRAERDREEARKFAMANFARDILTLGDNMSRAIENMAKTDTGDSDVLNKLIEGVKMIDADLVSTLERHNIRRLDPLGEKFDPNFHQAMFEVPDPNAEPGTVVQVLQAGYVISDRLLRPAMVGVAKAAGGEPNPNKVDTSA